jgi:hypothetical protein
MNAVADGGRITELHPDKTSVAATIKTIKQANRFIMYKIAFISKKSNVVHRQILTIHQAFYTRRRCPIKWGMTSAVSQRTKHKQS